MAQGTQETHSNFRFLVVTHRQLVRLLCCYTGGEGSPKKEMGPWPHSEGRRERTGIRIVQDMFPT